MGDSSLDSLDGSLAVVAVVGHTRGEEHHRVVVVAGHKERRAGSLENMRLIAIMIFGNVRSGFGMGHTAVCPSLS